MLNPNGYQAKRSQYVQDAVLSATPAGLLTMLYDRLLLDLARAGAAQESADWAVASENLLHAQDIVAELMSSLRTDVWDGAAGLLSIYTYVRQTLVGANVGRDRTKTAECADILEPLRLAWHEAARTGAPAAPAMAAATATGAPRSLGVLGVG
ncbi:flagellar export chaperone FliS [Arthrobacter agilis]|uniref:flagellar export chaperone FliS n=1 Tax=Arthrobacter agilis TaxID=37921 RepID=UPI000B351AFA|nr:flagellar export chaperone FliS [Arthrobacter agilis]OUM43731.1 flagellar export chaperone FliS [Arthrobacter agilis]PPB46684.1 flagellar export chaperone FliS [Arthrobacter agilis]TPV24973.1 flagellar export chaperone FliS [Arthrobacter agilis]VDR31148.1 Flagellar protein fliS [Arthrobacter agilis]